MAKTPKRNTNWFFDAQAFGRALRKRREEEGYTLRSLSEAVTRETSAAYAKEEDQAQDGFYISTTAIGKWETGESVPDFDSLLALVITLNPTGWETELLNFAAKGMAPPCAEEVRYARAVHKAHELLETLQNDRDVLESTGREALRTLQLFKTTPRDLLDTRREEAGRLFDAYEYDAKKYNSKIARAKKRIADISGDPDFMSDAWPEEISPVPKGYLQAMEKELQYRKELLTNLLETEDNDHGDKETKQQTRDMIEKLSKTLEHLEPFMGKKELGWVDPTEPQAKPRH